MLLQMALFHAFYGWIIFHYIYTISFFQTYYILVPSWNKYIKQWEIKHTCEEHGDRKAHSGLFNTQHGGTIKLSTACVDRAAGHQYLQSHHGGQSPTVPPRASIPCYLCLCVYTVPYLLYPFLCQWTFRLLPCLGYSKQCCNERWGAYILNQSFLWIYAQKWDCWITW